MKSSGFPGRSNIRTAKRKLEQTEGIERFAFQGVLGEGHICGETGAVDVERVNGSRSHPKMLVGKLNVDRGSQYTSEQFLRLMADHGIICSMSRSGMAHSHGGPRNRTLRAPETVKEAHSPALSGGGLHPEEPCNGSGA
jgi:hypothetical protein